MEGTWIRSALPALQAHWVDLAMLGWLIVSVLIGIVRGLVFEAFLLLGWAVAFFAAEWLMPAVAPLLPLGEPGSELNHAAAFGGAFLGVLIVWSLVSRVVRALVRATPLSLADRVLGAAFGALRAVLLLLALAVGVGFTPWASSLAWQQSQGATWLNATLRSLKPLLPSDVSQHLPA